MVADAPAPIRWTGRTTGPFLVVVGAHLLVAAVVLLVAALVQDDLAVILGGVLTLLVAAVVVLAFASVEVTVDEQGLRARSRPVVVARVHFAPADIDAVRVVQHRTLSWGIASGWGYRGSLRLFGRAAWVLRSGPALELDLVGGKRFTITVDDAEAAAVALQTAINRAG